MANYLRVPGMNHREGFFGIYYLNHYMYAWQPPVWLGMGVIAAVYFIYGFAAGVLLSLSLRFLRNEDQTKPTAPGWNEKD